jgi:uncharacterized membrane protein YobD (UPF0266 family)
MINFHILIPGNSFVIPISDFYCEDNKRLTDLNSLEDILLSSGFLLIFMNVFCQTDCHLILRDLSFFFGYSYIIYKNIGEKQGKDNYFPFNVPVFNVKNRK